MSVFCLHSPHVAGGFSGVERRKALRLTLCFLPPKINSGGSAASFGAQSFHQFFGKGTQGHPHQRVSQQLAKHKASMEEDNLIGTQKNGDGFDLNTKTIKPAEFVNEAAQWAAKLTEKAESQTGKTETALKTVARQTGVSHNTLWMLRYRKPKDIAVSVYMKLKAAFEAAEKRQYERDKHDATIAGSLGTANSRVLQAEAQEYVDFYESRILCKINNGAAGD